MAIDYVSLEYSFLLYVEIIYKQKLSKSMISPCTWHANIIHYCILKGIFISIFYHLKGLARCRGSSDKLFLMKDETMEFDIFIIT